MRSRRPAKMGKEVENALDKNRIPDDRSTDIASEEPGSLQRHASNFVTHDSFIIARDDRILVTGAAGFIGSRVVDRLVDRGFRNILCFARPSSDLTRVEAMVKRRPQGARIEVLKG